MKEIETEEELSGYHQLEEYHYRGKVLHGRHAPLVATTDDPALPLVLGYIELSTAFIMNRPRAIVLDDNFSDHHGQIRWDRWRKDAAREYTNVLVRIARTVVSPEFRGIGLARVLVKHAARFARQHWHVAGVKPLFMEITADMLRYVPFVQSAGMLYIGDTEGNLGRINKDMKYILKNYARVKRREILKEESGGIVDLQVAYAASLVKVERTAGIPRKRLLNLLLKAPERLSESNWELLHRLFRLPKPTFLMGLTSLSEDFLRMRMRKLGLPGRYNSHQPAARSPRLKGPIQVTRCTYSLSASSVKTRETRRIQQAFGVKPGLLTTTVFANLTFTINPGDILLVCGPSGAGKTSLLALLRSALLRQESSAGTLQGTITVPQGASVRTLGPLHSSAPLVNALGDVSLEDALFALNVSGLAEAHLYVKCFRQLSNGQRYRAMVAKLIASGTDVWVADEFCATLDPITANIVARNVRGCAKELGVTAILATANWTDFIGELRPDIVVHLRSPWDSRVFSWSEFQRTLQRSRVLPIMAEDGRRKGGPRSK